MSDQTRRFILRDRTSQAHASVDKLVGSFDTPDDYLRYLQGMASFRIPLEASLAAAHWPAHWDYWRPSTIGAAIRSDIHDLGDGQPEPGHGDVAPVPASEEALLGTLYVIMGSNLGAQILYKRAQAIGFTEDHGARHLAIQAGGIGDWRAFLALLDNVGALDMDAVVDAALLTFGSAERAFADARHVA